MAAERVATNDIHQKKNLKRKTTEEEPTSEEEEVAQQLLLLKEGKSTTMNESSKPVLQEENGNLSCKFCKKKFLNSQSLGGHQNAHKNERNLLKRQKELETKTFVFEPTNVNLYPYSFCHGAQMMHPMAHIPNQGFSLPPHNFGMTSSLGGGVPTSQWRLNLQAAWQEINKNESKNPSFEVGAGFSGSQGSSSASENHVGGSSSSVQGNPSMSTKDSPSEDLDMSTKDSPSEDLDLSLKL